MNLSLAALKWWKNPDQAMEALTRMKAFDVEVYEDGSAMITCPHTQQEPPNKFTDTPQGPCGHGFIVDYEAWVNTRKKFTSRSCPYCFRAARMPEVKEVKEEQAVGQE